MQKVDDIKVLNIDGDKRLVDDMSQQVQQLVEVYNDWNREEADLRQQLMKVQSAKNDLSRQIISSVREDDQADQEDQAPTDTGSSDDKSDQ